MALANSMFPGADGMPSIQHTIPIAVEECIWYTMRIIRLYHPYKITRTCMWNQRDEMMLGELLAGRKFIAASLLAAVLTCGPASNGQLAGANLSGSVKDDSGASVPNVSISIRDTATDAVRELESNSDGLYSAPNLPPGNYELTVTAKG